MINHLGALPETKGIPVHFVQDYEIWDVWNSDQCWREAARRADEPKNICIEMADISPLSATLRKKKAKVDEALTKDIDKIVVSPWLSELLEESFGLHQVFKVPNGIDTSVFYPDSEHPNSVRIDDESITVLFPSRSPKYKCTDHAIAAVDSLQSLNVSVQAITFGWNPPRLPNWINSLGRVTDAELRRLYSSADLFINPSRAEGWGLSPLEALACGTSVVSTITGWVRDYDTDEVVLGVPPNNKNELAAAVQRLIMDDDLRQTMADQGPDFVKQNFSKESTTDTFENVLRQIKNSN
jgi:glycosyltransferase involved in cell wall biosynthesis